MTAKKRPADPETLVLSFADGSKVTLTPAEIIAQLIDQKNRRDRQIIERAERDRKRTVRATEAKIAKAAANRQTIADELERAGGCVIAATPKRPRAGRSKRTIERVKQASQKRK